MITAPMATMPHSCPNRTMRGLWRRRKSLLVSYNYHNPDECLPSPLHLPIITRTHTQNQSVTFCANISHIKLANRRNSTLTIKWEMCLLLVSWLGISTIWHWKRTATPPADRLWHSGNIIISRRLAFNSSRCLLHVADQQFFGLQKGEELVVWPFCSMPPPLNYSEGGGDGKNWRLSKKWCQV